MLPRLIRILVVTAGLSVAGAVAGAFAGGIAFSFVLTLAGDPGLHLDALLIAGVVGAPLGAVTAPLLAWLLLRRVPLGQMFRGLSLGTMVGGVVGWLATVSAANIVINAVASAFIGCVVAALLLRRRVVRRLEA